MKGFSPRSFLVFAIIHELSNLLIPIVRDMKQEIADLKNRIEMLEA